MDALKSNAFVGLFILLSTIYGNAQHQTKRPFRDLSKDSIGVSIPFYSGLKAYHAFRIPTIIKSNTALIAFAEGRKNSTSDFGDIDLTYRRSLNNGATWEELKILYDLDTLAVQNPVPIYVASENKIVLLFNTTSLSEHDVLHTDYPKNRERKAYLTMSTDDGLTWRSPKEITQQVKRNHWRWHAIGPVHGIELKHESSRGRLVAPVAISIEKGNEAYCMALIYSDDQGENWNIGAVDTNLTDAVRSNETTIVELTDGRIYVNTRDHLGGSKLKNRGETYSVDGGLSFTKPIIESDNFPSPIVQSALLRWAEERKEGENSILFSTPSDREKRVDLMIMVSYDESESWTPFIKVHDGHSAYSDMVKLDKTTLGVIYETDDYQKIRFRSIKMD